MQNTDRQARILAIFNKLAQVHKCLRAEGGKLSTEMQQCIDQGLFERFVAVRTGRGGLGECIAQAAVGKVGALRQEHGALGKVGRPLHRAPRPGPDARQHPE